MVDYVTGELCVVVPVGFLLTEEQEVSVSVDLKSGTLPIRLRLVPARVSAIDPSSQTPAPVKRMSRQQCSEYDDDGYPAPEYGGGG